MKTATQALSLGLVAVGLITASAHADVTVYSGADYGVDPGPIPNSNYAQSQWYSAAVSLPGGGSYGLINFEAITQFGYFSAPLTVATGVTVSGPSLPSLIMENQDQGYFYGFNTTPAGSNFLFEVGGSATFTFSTPIQAFGCYITGAQPETFSETVTFNDGPPQTVPIAQGGDGGCQFLGFTDPDQPIYSVTFNSGNDAIGIDDVQYVIVPEPSTLAFTFVGGLTLLTFVKRKRADRKTG
ncbi:MAG TPA: PEP-CTERM sorting domain-containing protein [Verrucomicrobiae bacterium]|nr:PEP-CTERM sorting domain-containing protein [Verrucomicrobiae bacterium]